MGGFDEQVTLIKELKGPCAYLEGEYFKQREPRDQRWQQSLRDPLGQSQD